MREEMNVEDEVKSIVCYWRNCTPAQCTSSATLDSLGLQHFPLMRVVVSIKNQFNVEVPIDGRVRTFGELVAYVVDNMK